MKKYEVNTMAVLVDLMAEALGCGIGEILAGMQGHIIDEEEAGEINRVIEEWKSEAVI